MHHKISEQIKLWAKKLHIKLTYKTNSGKRKYKTEKKITMEIMSIVTYKKKTTKSKFKPEKYMLGRKHHLKNDDEDDEADVVAEYIKRPTSYPISDVRLPKRRQLHYDLDTVYNEREEDEEGLPKPGLEEIRRSEQLVFEQGYEQFKKFLSQFPLSMECRGPQDYSALWLVYRAKQLSVLGNRGGKYSSVGACILPLILNQGNVGRLTLPKSAQSTKLEEIDWEGTIDAIKKCATTHRLIMWITGYIGHANLAVLDTELKTLERMDPHGTIGSDPQLQLGLDQQMAILVKASSAALGKVVSYLSPKNICIAEFGPQAWADPVIDMPECKDKGGYCLVFSWLYGDLRMQFPNIRPDEIINQMLSENKKNLMIIVRQYLSYVRSILPQEQTEESQRMLSDFNNIHGIPYFKESVYGQNVFQINEKIRTYEDELKVIVSRQHDYLSMEGRQQLTNLYTTWGYLVELHEQLEKTRRAGFSSESLTQMMLQDTRNEYKFKNEKLSQYASIITDFLLTGPIQQLSVVLEKMSSLGDKEHVLTTLFNILKVIHQFAVDYHKYYPYRFNKKIGELVNAARDQSQTLKITLKQFRNDILSILGELLLYLTVNPTMVLGFQVYSADQLFSVGQFKLTQLFAKEGDEVQRKIGDFVKTISDAIYAGYYGTHIPLTLLISNDVKTVSKLTSLGFTEEYSLKDGGLSYPVLRKIY